MTSSDSTQRAMDDAIRAHMADNLGEGEVHVSHLVLVGVRSIDNDGHHTGRVALLMADGSMAVWEAKGLIYEAIDVIADTYETDEP